jgi:DNA-3-methyladenine glycosylase
VYFSMGLHHCVNVVCEPAGHASAVLLRAAEPVEGLAAMARRRGVAQPRALLSGPGKLCQAFGITRTLDGADALDGATRLVAGATPQERILCGPRIGISRAQELSYRFFLEGEAHVTRSALNRAGRAWRGERRGASRGGLEMAAS